MDDAALIYELSNEEIVRENSINRKRITYPDHLKWLTSVVADDNYVLFIVEQQGLFCGQVKFEIRGNEAIISISLSENIRGKSQGKPIIIEAIQYFSESMLGVSEIVAFIKPSNIASIKSFAGAGFVHQKNVLFSEHTFGKFVRKSTGVSG
jgi:RimJ/RimL family protein N-acetyltransferase